MTTTTEFTATLPTPSGSGLFTYTTEVWTNLGPLTTTITPLAICQENAINQGLVVYSITLIPNNWTTASYDCQQATNGYTNIAACYPSSIAFQSFITGYTQQALDGAYWSPGIACPSAWYTAYSKTFTPALSDSPEADSDNAQRSMIGNQSMPATFVQCCPSGYALDHRIHRACTSQITTTTLGALCALTYGCSSPYSGSISACTPGVTAFSWDPSHTSTSVFVTAFPIDMMRQDSDLALVLHHNQKPQSQEQNGSSAGAKVIVPAVVIPLVALMAFVAFVVFCLRARGRRKNQSIHPTMPELHDEPLHHETEGAAKHELHNSSKPAEMEVKYVHELESGYLPNELRT